MRTGNNLPTRPSWYDRNPIERSVDFSNFSVAPAGSTQRGIYTVPANKKFIYEAGDTMVERATLAAPVGNIFVAIQAIAISGAFLNAPSIYSNLNVLNTQIHATLAPQSIFTAGATIAVQTQDLSTGGTLIIHSNFKGTEFDA